MYISFAYRAGKRDLITRNHSRCMSKCEMTSCPQRCVVELGINSLTVRIQMFHRGEEQICSRSVCISINRDSSLQFSSYKWLRNCRIVKQLLSAWPKKVLTSCGHSYSHTPHERSLSLCCQSASQFFKMNWWILKWIIVGGAALPSVSVSMSNSYALSVIMERARCPLQWVSLKSIKIKNTLLYTDTTKTLILDALQREQSSCRYAPLRLFIVPVSLIQPMIHVVVVSQSSLLNVGKRIDE